LRRIRIVVHGIWRRESPGRLAWRWRPLVRGRQPAL